MPRETFQNCFYQFPCPCDEPLPTNASTEDPPALAGLAGSPAASVLLSSGSWCVQDFVLPSKGGISISPSPVEGSPTIKFCWISRSDSLGIPSPFARFPSCEVWCGAQNLHNGGKTLVLLFSSLWVTHLVGMGFVFIMIVPCLPSHSSFFFVFGHEGSFFGGFQHPPADGCSTASCNFSVLAEDECMCFYSAILNQKPREATLLNWS